MEWTPHGTCCCVGHVQARVLGTRETSPGSPQEPVALVSTLGATQVAAPKMTAAVVVYPSVSGRPALLKAATVP